MLALAIGAAQAWLAERTDASLRQWLYVASIVSLGIPYVLYIVAWLLFLGKAGPVNAVLQHWFGGTGPYINVYSLGGMIFIEGLLWSPLAFLLLSPVFRNADASFEEAASICGAGIFSTLRHITFGMARPALLALGLLVFIKAAESFEVPALVGLPGSARVLTTTIYQRLTLDIPPDTGSASAFGVLLLVIMAVLLQIYSRVVAQSHRYQTVTGKGFRPRVVRLGRWRTAAGALIVAIPFIVVVIPMATILWAALLPYYQPFSLEALPMLGIGNFVQVWNSQSFRGSIVNSLVLGASAATLVTVLSAVAGWCVARRVSGGRIIDALAALPLVFPAIVLGLAFLEIFVHCRRANLRQPVVARARLGRRLHAVRIALCAARRHPDPSRARRGRRHRRRPASRDLRPHRAAAFGARPDLMLAVRVPAGGAGGVSDASPVRTGFAGRRGHAVRFLEQWADRRARSARLRVDRHHDGFQRRLSCRGAPLSTGHRLNDRRSIATCCTWKI